MCRAITTPTTSAFAAADVTVTHVISAAACGPHTDLIQAALLVCGLMTCVQVTGIRFPRSTSYQWGAGILSVMGISFASVPLFTRVISANMVSAHCSAAAGEERGRGRGRDDGDSSGHTAQAAALQQTAG